MNTITKEEILELILSNKQSLKVIREYCKEMGKEEILTDLFINCIATIDTSLLYYCYNYALDYFIRKYDIILIHDKNDNFITAYFNKFKQIKQT